MLKLGPSVIISHGMLDYLTFKNPDDIINYIILVVINYYMFAINNNMIFMFFLVASMYHFGEDFRYLTDGNYVDRSTGILFLTSIIQGSSGLKIICNMLDLDYVTFHEFTRTMLLISMGLVVLVNPKLQIISGVIVCIQHYIAPYTEFMLYLLFIHVATALYRYTQKYGRDILYSYLFYVTIICIFVPNIVNAFIIKLSISIVNVHMLYVTDWQNRHD